MKKQIKKSSLLCQLILLSTTTINSCFASASDTQLEDEVEKLRRELATLQNKIAALDANANTPLEGEAKLYVTLRPTFGYIDESAVKVWDTRDALSHAGFKAAHEIMGSLAVIAHGEWDISLANNGDFGRARQVYVALNSSFGNIGLGKQRPTQYLLIAGYIDIFNHASSPFAYDRESIFFVDNLISYKKNLGNFTYLTTAQFDGKEGADASDLVNTGISYDTDNLHLAITYLDQKIADGNEVLRNDDVWAGAVAYTFSNGLYTALAYQDRTYEELGANKRNGSTFDTAFAYPVFNNFKVKAGYFKFDDGIEGPESGKHDGYNVTLEWQPVSALKLHLEYLNREFEFSEDFHSFSLGFRYDYSISTRF
ncbi:porin [Agarilytica rhodophyticola]|uniref:porin n=1 Tax=Agarilytica rhodophyticola TaxID=1737490 RepID=UPI00131594CB|nr:porin [Agarilytica rhodophyticola]